MSTHIATNVTPNVTQEIKLTKENAKVIIIKESKNTRGGMPLPYITFTGHELHELGFIPQTLVRVACRGDELIFTASGIGIEAYQSVVHQARKQKEAIIYVQADRTALGGTRLTLEGAWLTRNGFMTFDVLIAHFADGLIKVRKLPFEAVTCGATRRLNTITSDRKKSGNILSAICFAGQFLKQVHFTIGTVALVKCQTNKLTLTRAETGVMPEKKPYGQQPACITVKRCTDTTHPKIRLSGLWLQDFGFYPQDKIIITALPNLITIEPLKRELLTW